MGDVLLPHTFVDGPGNVASGEEVMDNFQAILDQVNGNLDSDNLASALLDALGVSTPAVKRRGKTIIPAEQVTADPAFTFLATPDVVEDIVLPQDGLIVVAYQALWKEEFANAASAGIFLNGNQMKYQSDVAPNVRDIKIAAANLWTPLSTTSIGGGLTGWSRGGINHGDDVTTGQQVASWDVGGLRSGGVTHIFAAAGTYDVGIKFKSGGGNVSVKGRKLWVWTIGF